MLRLASPWGFDQHGRYWIGLQGIIWGGGTVSANIPGQVGSKNAGICCPKMLASPKTSEE